jgi:glucosamine kinase
MQLFLGVDGGGTGCRAAVADAAGAILGRGAAASANILSDPEGARANILAAARSALAGAGAGDEFEDVRAVLGLAGANVATAVARLRAGLPFAHVAVESDAVIALKGALGEGDGIAATIGTGSVFARQQGGVVAMIGGWGFVLGDQGSGARMGRALLEAALLAHDGLGAATPLMGTLIAEAGGPEALVAFARTAAPADFAAFAPRIVAAAGAGDPVAGAILDEAAEAVGAAIARLQTEPPLPVCFLGGLGPVFAERLAPRYSGLTRAPLGSALDGALALARRLE